MWLLLSIAWAQVPPSALEVVSLDASSACPDVPETHVPGVVRTSAGLALHAGDGTYTFGCPSRLGGAPPDDVAASPDGSQLMVLVDGVAWFSDSGGCASEPLAVAEGTVVSDVLHWRDAFWVLALDPATASTSLLRIDGGATTELTRWGFLADGMAASGADTLWVSGVAPLPEIRRLGFTGGLTDSGPLGPIPEDSLELDRLVPRIASDDEVWFAVARRSDAWLWHGATTDAGVTLTDDGDRHAVVHGPVIVDGQWVVALDQHLWTSDLLSNGDWDDTTQDVLWTCLFQAGERAFACTIAEMLAFHGLGEGLVPETAAVFSMAQISGTEASCGVLGACDAEWSAAASALGITGAEVAVCPDGRTLADLAPDPCACAAPGPTVAWWGLPLVFGWRRRRQG